MSLRSAHDAWRSRPAAERWLIGLPAVALLAAIMYLGLLEPLQASIVRLRAALPELASRRDVIRGETGELRAPPGTVAVAALRPAQITAALERRQLPAGLASIEPAGEKRLRLAFARIPFHAVWPLLQELQTEGVRVVSLRLDRLDASQVRLDAVLGTGEP